MIWFSGDSAERILYEIRRDERGEGFELRLVHSNGRLVLERFQNANELAQGARKVQTELRGSGWRTSQRRD
jgi:hypothetical protein